MKINGYDLYSGFGIMLSSDRATTNSFEVPNDPKPVFSHDWGGEDGIEYDLTSPISLAPRVFTITGTMFADTIDNYNASKLALSSVLYGNYVTVEIPELSIKVNAKLKPGGMKWQRLTPITAERIVAYLSFQLDEVMQDVPFIDNGGGTITYLVDNQMRYYNTQNNKFLII
jgi:hypothetical protein